MKDCSENEEQHCCPPQEKKIFKPSLHNSDVRLMSFPVRVRKSWRDDLGGKCRILSQSSPRFQESVPSSFSLVSECPRASYILVTTYPKIRNRTFERKTIGADIFSQKKNVFSTQIWRNKPRFSRATSDKRKEELFWFQNWIIWRYSRISFRMCQEEKIASVSLPFEVA